MNREVKFRGKKPDGKWVFGYLTGNNCIGQNIVLPRTVGQYTGVKDAFLQDIYEGDLVDIPYIEKPAVVGFLDGRFCAIDDDRCDWSLKMAIRVVGNIHEDGHWGILIK